MRKLLVTVVFVLVSAAVAQAAPLTPPICDTAGTTECAPGPVVLPPYPVAGEGFLPVATNSSTGTVGPRVDWIVLPNINPVTGAPLLSGPGAGAFIYVYQIESASGAAPGDVRGDISRFTLSTGLIFPSEHNLTSMGIAEGDLDNDGTRFFFGTAVPTNGDGTAVLAADLVLYGAVDLAGHNCTNFANLCAPTGESELDGAGVAFGDAEGDEVGVASVEGNSAELAWAFILKILHAATGGADNGEESIILWAMGPTPVYGAGAALDGAPFSPWSTLNPNGRPVPVARTVPEPASLFLLGSGIVAAGLITRRLRTRKP